VPAATELSRSHTRRGGASDLAGATIDSQQVLYAPFISGGLICHLGVRAVSGDKAW
jgi:hypothetical protein